MKLSPLQLVRYLMPDVFCVAYADYDPEKPRHYGDQSLQVSGSVTPMKADKKDDFSTWSVDLELQLEPSEDTNVPYRIAIKLVGLFRCSSTPADMPTDAFVQANGSSILYGIARELIRGLTAIGPWGQVLLPTLSFTPETPSTATRSSPPKTAKKKKKV
ncbi:MAG: hypothetical protein V4672_18760 [Verrucomicrobiota bacterium]